MRMGMHCIDDGVDVEDRSQRWCANVHILLLAVDGAAGSVRLSDEDQLYHIIRTTCLLFPSWVAHGRDGHCGP